MKKKIIIIGGGIGGLATAALLGKDGHEVTVLEKNKAVGGRASVWEEKGFTFDMGPSWYMMPDVFEHYFSLFDKKPSDFYELIELNPRYTVFFDNKRKYTLTSSLQENIRLFNSIEKDGGKKLQQFLRQSEHFYSSAMNKLVYLDYTSLTQLFSAQMMTQLLTMKLFKSYHLDVSSFFNNKDLQKILEFPTVFLGGSPYITPAFYTLIAHTDFNLKIWHPKGGIYKVIEAFETLCKQYNVKILTNTEVTSISVSDNKVTSVIANGTRFDANVVISNADYAYSEMQLLDKANQTYSHSYWEKKTLSPSALMVYVGLNQKLKNVSHHNLYFSDTWEQHFQEVYDNPQWPQNPSYYVNIPSVTDPSLVSTVRTNLIILSRTDSGSVLSISFAISSFNLYNPPSAGTIFSCISINQEGWVKSPVPIILIPFILPQ